MLRPFPARPLICVSLANFPIPLQLQNAVRDDGRNDEPKRRRRDQRIYDDRTYATSAHKDRRDEIKIENPVQPPIQRAEKHENVGNKIGNYHTVFSFRERTPSLYPYFAEKTEFYTREKNLVTATATTAPVAAQKTVLPSIVHIVVSAIGERGEIGIVLIATAGVTATAAITGVPLSVPTATAATAVAAAVLPYVTAVPRTVVVIATPKFGGEQVEKSVRKPIAGVVAVIMTLIHIVPLS